MKLSESSLANYNAQRKTSATGLSCWAPFKSMYFGFRGNTSVCCFNKTHVIGKYPEKSIRDIWFGEKANEIRESLRENDFSLGCHGCHELISAGNYKGLPAKNFDSIPLNRENYPSKIDFELSNECNLECIMCRGEFSSAIRRNREKLPPIKSAYDKEFVDQLEEFIPYLENSHFLGGEPFMIPIYLDIWERMYTINPNVRISVQTNATILTDRVKRILESMRFEIAISIDSIVKETYAVIRKNGDLEKVMENIHYFREYCNKNQTNFHISYCPMVQNWEELPDVIDFANNLNCHVFFNTVFHPAECSISYLDSNEISKIIQFLEAYDPPSTNTIERENRDSYEQIVKQFRFWKDEALDREKLANLTGQVNDFDSYRNGFGVYLSEHSDLSDSDKQSLIDDIFTKLAFVLDEAEKHDRRHLALDHLITIDYKTIHQSVPGIKKEHMLYLFKSFIMPLPD